MTRYAFQSAAVSAAYHDILVPRLFTPWAEELLDSVGVAAGARVLDVACGPGTVARLAARRAGTSGEVIGADLSADMLALARARPAAPGAAPIAWIQTAAAPLAARDAAHDVVTCQQGLQFFPDRAAALAEMRRVLRPGGRLAVAVWSRLPDCTIFAALHAGLGTTAPELAERVDLPFSWPEPGELGAALAAAGFRDVAVSTRVRPMLLEDGPGQAVDVLRAMPLWPALEALPDATRAAAVAACVAELARLPRRRGAVRGTMVANVALARR